MHKARKLHLVLDVMITYSEWKQYSTLVDSGMVFSSLYNACLTNRESWEGDANETFRSSFEYMVKRIKNETLGR